MPNKDILSIEELHDAFLTALQDSVESHSDIEEKPLNIALKPPLPSHVRLYIFNATQPPGGRPADEYKIQLIVPGQNRGERGSLNNAGVDLTLLVGYERELGVFIFWDADLYPDFGYSRNVQVKAETIYTALGGDIGEQYKRRRGVSNEIVYTALPNKVPETIMKRIDTTISRILSD